MKAISDRRRRNLAQVFAMPLLLAAATIAGLVIGLTGEGSRDGLSWFLLAIPLVVFGQAWMRRRR